MADRDAKDVLGADIVTVRRAEKTQFKVSHNPRHKKSLNLGSAELAAKIQTLSSGWVADIRPTGPVLDADTPRVIREASDELFTPALTRTSQRWLNFAVLLWVVLVLCFIVWWFTPDHVGTRTGLILNTSVAAFLLLLPIAFVSRIHAIRRINPEIPLPDARVALVTTRAPSEPFSEVQPTLEAMLRQNYQADYDVWLCDEAPPDEIYQWCATNGVHISTRHNEEDYHRSSWPRRTRCKEGNLAYFYDNYGYENYDIVGQFDCDHIPEPDYLEAILRPFSDPNVGYVAAPSMCDLNQKDSWSARGRLYAEAMIHGPHQSAHNGGLTPTCIGSHYAVRTADLAKAGGIGPELAEDFSTSYVIRLTGADGAFAIDAKAHGQGPSTFAAMITQEFQWCRSLTVLLFTLVGRTLHVYRPRLKFRFLFALLVMPAMGLMTGAGFLIAPLAVIFDQQWMSMSLLNFIVFTTVVSLPLVGMLWILRRAGLLRPNDVPVINWESGLFQIVRWPYVVRGFFAGLRQVIFRNEVHFQVTPKGDLGVQPISLRVMLPYHFLTIAMIAIGVWGVIDDRSPGYAGLTLLGGLIYGFVCFFVPWMHFHELPSAQSTLGERFRAVALPLLTGLVMFLVSLVALVLYIAIFFGGYQWVW
ncbi:glycosyltransferase family 2 protein [Corynebacterium crudilactis]|uniref:glycosyltransferase family 2 protein n=1 Tax=Corynebacterium crudilactis TaxID=1652495 RepID=UPI001FE21C88|nr:glycosyltransferase family 2 protein [Corynebacterium crudilactis]